MTSSGAGREERGGDWLVALALAILLAGIFLVSPQRRFLDSKFALLTSQALLERGSFDLSPYLPWLAPRDGVKAERGLLPYQLRHSQGRLLYLYPPGTPVLSVPLVAALRVAGYDTLDARGIYDRAAERDLQRLLASWITAGTALLVFWAARRELARLPAALVALATGLGTGLWSAASRVLWTHTLSTFLVAAIWLELLRWEDGERQRGWLLGALAAALFWVRPTGAVVALAVAIYVLVRHRSALAGLLTAGAVGCAAFVLLAFELWGQLFPRYFGYGKVLVGERPNSLITLLDITISPGRGLLAYSPILLLVVWWLARHGVGSERRALAWLAAGVTVGYLAVYSRWGWGGTVGPRFLCDPTAIFAWLGAHGWRRAREREPDTMPRRAAAGAVAALLLAASFAAHGAIAWNVRPEGAPRQRVAGEAQRAAAAQRRTDAAEARPAWLSRRFLRPYWNWRTLPQLAWPDVLAELDARDRRVRNLMERRERRRAAAARAEASPDAPAAPPEAPE